MRKLLCLCASFALVLAASSLRAEDNSEVEMLKRELEEVRAANKDLRSMMEGIRKDLNSNRQEAEMAKKKYEIHHAPIAKTDDFLDKKYGPDNNVTTKNGKLTMGGLVQVWFYSIQNDTISYGDPRPTDGDADYGSNEVADNDSFRVRRAELKFTMDIHENVRAVVMIDPARSATSFPGLPSNQTHSPDFSVWYNNGVEHDPDDLDDGIDDADSDGLGAEAIGHVNRKAVQNGTGTANRLLQDAYISYHSFLPHHDITVGQFLPHLGEEGIRDSGQLDFAERSMVGQLTYNRDIGLELHGSWWDERLQYWAGAFNGSGTAFQLHSNRSNDNDDFDLTGAILVRPVWKNETWGSLELGYSIRWGMGGEQGFTSRENLDNPSDGLDRARTVHQLMNAHMSYLPGGPVRGWWIRGEWTKYRDRWAPETVAAGSDDNGSAFTSDPAPFTIQGWTVSTGYKIADSTWGDCVPSWFTPFEFTFRYETMENLFYHDLDNEERELDVFATRAYTAGINYHINPNTKLQFNYIKVDEQTSDNPNGGFDTGRQTHEVRNDVFVVTFQVGW